MNKGAELSNGGGREWVKGEEHTSVWKQPLLQVPATSEGLPQKNLLGHWKVQPFK